MEHEHGNGSSKHQTVHPEAISNDGLVLTKQTVEHENEIESSKRQILHPKANSNNEDLLIHDKMSDHSSRSSSSSSSNPLEVDDDESDMLDTSFSKLEEDGPRSPTQDPQSSPDAPSHTPQWSLMSSSPGNGPGTELLLSTEASPQSSEWGTANASLKNSPVVQVMDQPPGYDPNRIPQSVFATKSTNPTEWSMASNESLFSIHMGNNSFSRDHAILMSKSGELNRPDDRIYSPYSVTETKSSDLNSMTASLPPVIETASESDRKSASIDGESREKEEDFEVQNVVYHNYGRDLEKVNLPTSGGVDMSSANLSVSDGKGMHPADGSRTSASTPRLSDESGNSVRSFAFPVLGSGGGSLKEGADKEKPAPPRAKREPEPQPQTPIATPKASGNRWFSCFSCCPLCC